jgi:hypothetical protein
MPDPSAAEIVRYTRSAQTVFRFPAGFRPRPGFSLSSILNLDHNNPKPTYGRMPPLDAAGVGALPSVPAPLPRSLVGSGVFLPLPPNQVFGYHLLDQRRTRGHEPAADNPLARAARR